MDELFDFEESTSCPHCGRALHGGVCMWCDKPPTPPKHLHRASGPATSASAAHSVDATALEVMVLTAIEEAGAAGLTADELLERFSEYSYSSITARPAALKRKGMIADSGRKRRGRSGRNQAVLVATRLLGKDMDDSRTTADRPSDGTIGNCPSCGKPCNIGYYRTCPNCYAPIEGQGS